jgi:hypothetical protein
MHLSLSFDALAARQAELGISTKKAIAEVKRMLVERQVPRNFTMPLAVGKA